MVELQSKVVLNVHELKEFQVLSSTGSNTSPIWRDRKRNTPRRREGRARRIAGRVRSGGRGAG
jgi:hypothetical protein